MDWIGRVIFCVILYQILSYFWYSPLVYTYRGIIRNIEFYDAYTSQDMYIEFEDGRFTSFSGWPIDIVKVGDFIELKVCDEKLVSLKIIDTRITIL